MGVAIRRTLRRRHTGQGPSQRPAAATIQSRGSSPRNRREEDVSPEVSRSDRQTRSHSFDQSHKARLSRFVVSVGLLVADALLFLLLWGTCSEERCPSWHEWLIAITFVAALLLLAVTLGVGA